MDINFKQYLLQCGKDIKNLDDHNLKKYQKKYDSLDRVNLEDYIISSFQLPKGIADKYNAILFYEKGSRDLKLAISSFEQYSVIEEVKGFLSFSSDVKIYLAHINDIKHYLSNILLIDKSTFTLAEEAKYEANFSVVEPDKQVKITDTSIVSLINNILELGIKNNIIDIHFEYVNRNTVSVLFRDRNGCLKQHLYLYESIAHAIRQSLLLQSNCDILALNKCYDSAINIYFNGNEYILRLSYIPTAKGYSFVLRIGYPYTKLFELENIIYFKDVYSLVTKILKLRSGLILVSGRVASGKTTLLYSILNFLQYNSNYGFKILTFEDPIETTLLGVNQIETSSIDTQEYSSFLKGALRQDLDILVFGELRDQLTASYAVTAALTGTLVIATIHATHPHQSYNRILNLGVSQDELDLVYKASIGTYGIKKICPFCHYKKGEWIYNNQKFSYWKAKGCSHCDFYGFQGYIYIQSFFEQQGVNIMEITKELASLVNKGIICLEDLRSIFDIEYKILEGI